MVRIEDRLRLMIKLIFFVSVKVCAFTYLGSLYLGDLYITVRSICIRSISIKRLSACIDILLWEYLGFTMVVLAGFILAGAILVLPLLMILRLILH